MTQSNKCPELTGVLVSSVGVVSITYDVQYCISIILKAIQILYSEFNAIQKDGNLGKGILMFNC